MSLHADDFARPTWTYANGPWSSIVLWSSAELRRNVAGRAFCHCLEDQERTDILTDLKAAADRCDDLPVADTDLMLAHDAARGAPLFGTDETQSQTHRRLSSDGCLGMDCLDQDHLLIRALRPGLDPVAAMGEAMALGRTLEDQLGFAYDDRFGFLTADPKHCGTGLRLSALLHLPGLVQSGEAPERLGELSEQRILLQGWYAEEERVHGDLFLLTTSSSLGRSEKVIAREFARSLAELVSHESKARQSMLETQRRLMEDRIFRSLGILQSARLLSTGEAIGRLSLLRLGIALEILKSPDLDSLHVLLMGARLVDPNEHLNEATRADLLRRALTEDGPSPK